MHCFRSPVGGLFRHVRDLVRAQNAAGHLTGIVCDRSTGGAFEDGMLAALAPDLSLGLWRVAMQRHIGPRDIPAAFRTGRIIASLAPDVLHGHGAKGGFYARLIGTMLRRPAGGMPARIYSPHGGSLHYDPHRLSGRLIFGVERLLEPLTDQILFVSGHEADVYRRKVGAPRRACKVIANGLHPEEFEAVATEADAADFLFIGMMRGVKGPDLFLDALHRGAARAGRALSAVMVGDGDDLPRIREQAGRLGLPVRFLPPMPVRQALRLGRAMVVSSRAEAMPYIVLEALAASVPVIATRVGGIPEIFGDRADLLCAPDADELARRLAEAASDFSALAQRMPDARNIRARFCAAEMARRIEESYCESL